jgi:hypothetical protein
MVRRPGEQGNETVLQLVVHQALCDMVEAAEIFTEDRQLHLITVLHEVNEKKSWESLARYALPRSSAHMLTHRHPMDWTESYDSTDSIPY